MLFELKAQEPRWLNPVKLRCQVKRGLLCFYSLVIIHAQSVRPGNGFTNAAQTFERVRSQPSNGTNIHRSSMSFFQVINFWNVENPRVATNFLLFPSSHGPFSPAQEFSFAVLTLNKRKGIVSLRDSCVPRWWFIGKFRRCNYEWIRWENLDKLINIRCIIIFL